MKGLKLTALFSSLLLLILATTSCERAAEERKTTDFEKKGILMTGAQNVPISASTGLGSMDVFYSKETRTLTYTILWSGLADSVASVHIHGLAPAGFLSTNITQNIVAASNGIFPAKTNNKFTYLKTGTLSGSLLADGVFVKEQDILNGVYYLDIHTNSYPGGEIRGQIKFQ